MRTWIVSDNVLCADLVPRALGLRIEDGIIREIRSREELQGARPVESSLVVDHGAAPLVPGWVNAHVHLAMAPLRGATTRSARAGNVIEDVFFRVESKLERRDVLAFTRLAAMESLLSGVTEVWDHYYFADAAAEALADVGLSGTVAPTLQDLSGPGADTWEEALELTETLATARALGQGVSVAVGIHASDTASPQLLTRAGELARRHDLPVHMHLLQHADEVARSSLTYPEGIAEGVLERLGDTRLLVAHALFATNGDLEQLTTRGATLAFCPLSQAQFGFLSPIAEWTALGGRFALGTDTVASNDSLDLQRELSHLVGLPGLAASFGDERRAVLAASDTEEQVRTARALERWRQAQTQLTFPVEPEVLLPAAWGVHLPGGPRGIAVGAPANLLVLDPNDPALFPSSGLLRALCAGSLGNAIQQVYCRGKPIFPGVGARAAFLDLPAYRDALAEAGARSRELWYRARGR